VPFRGDRLRGIREHKGLRPAELARRAKLNRASIQHLENHDTPNPRTDTLDALTSQLDVTEGWLMGVGQDLPYARAAVLQALKRFTDSEGWKHQPLDEAALLRASAVEGAPETAAGWRAYVEMKRAEPAPPKRQLKAEKPTRALVKPALRFGRGEARKGS